MWPFPKRKRIAGNPTSPEHSGGVDYSTMQLSELQAELAKTQGKLNVYESELTELFRAKVAGNLHDGDYNQKTSAIGQDEVRLRGIEQRLLTAISEKTADIARLALHQDYE